MSGVLERVLSKFPRLLEKLDADSLPTGDLAESFMVDIADLSLFQPVEASMVRALLGRRYPERLFDEIRKGKIHIEKEFASTYRDVLAAALGPEYVREALADDIRKHAERMARDDASLDEIFESLRENHSAEEVARAEDTVYDVYTSVNMRSVFNLIREYPDSEDRYFDLLVSQNYQTKRILRGYKRWVYPRVLNPGVLEEGILLVLSNIIRLHISASDRFREVRRTKQSKWSLFVLDLLVEPIKVYLRDKRPNGVDIILNNIISGEDLYEELAKSSSGGSQKRRRKILPKDLKVIEQVYLEDYFSDEEDSWTVPKTRTDFALYIDPGVDDLIQHLLEIYELDVLLEKYRKTLASDLIYKTEGYENLRHVEITELLKIRFGEEALHHCEVMLKDMQDSKRDAKNIEVDNLEAIIISRVFWDFEEGKVIKEEPPFVLHPSIQEVFSKYQEQYENLKKPRTLKWIHDEGSIDLELGETGKKTFDLFTGSLLLYFSDRTSWSVGDLAEKLGVLHNEYYTSPRLKKAIEKCLDDGLLEREGDLLISRF